MMKKASLFMGFMLLCFSLFASSNDKVGVLVLAHGGDATWNATVKEAVTPLEKDYKVEIAFGMANPMSMQKGIDNLEKQGVETIVVVQLFVSSYSMIIRQNEYLLGFRNELADPPMLMMHGMHGGGDEGHGSEGHGHHGMSEHGHGSHGQADAEEPELNPLDLKAKVLLTKPLNDNPRVVDILLNRIKSMSIDPANETVILVAHGPNDEQDNEMWLSTLHNISIQVKSAFGTYTFRNIEDLTLRDDADKDIYNAAKEEFRGLVKEANKENGRALIVPVLLSKGGIEKRLQQRLDGLDFVWDGKTLLPDENITKFIKESVEESLSYQEQVMK